MELKKVEIDFTRKDGCIRALHGVNCAPYKHGEGAFVTKAFQDGKIPYSRLHDCMGIYGGAHFVDIPNIFPDFDADENNPANYDFTLTDEYIGCIVAAGTKIVYRLGITIDWGSKKYHTMPPKDFDKWSRICEHVVRHYNEGWADGFYWNIQDWEIWNEPENPPMWSGTKEEYFRLYATAAKHLRSCFPDIRIGGYGNMGFFALTRQDMGEFYESVVTWFSDFLDFVKSEQAPFDFFSWHIYNGDPEEVLTHAAYVRKMLDEKGFADTESSLNEWNYETGGSDTHLMKKSMDAASYAAAVMCGLQNSELVDTAMYYVASRNSIYNGIIRSEDNKYLKPFYVFCSWGQLWSLGNWHKPVMETGDGLYVCAASGKGEAGILLSNVRTEDTWVELELTGLSGVTAKFYLLDENGDMLLTKTEIFRGDTVIPVVKVGGSSVVYVSLIS